MTFNSLDYSLKFNVPSSSILEAKKNAGKIQYLMRMFYKTKYDGKTKLPASREDFADDVILSKLVFYIPSMIEMPNKSPFKSVPQDYKIMYKQGIPLFLENLDIDIDIEQGFFDDNGKLYPKFYSITMEMMHDDTDLVRPYYLEGSPEDEEYSISEKFYNGQQGQTPLIPSDQTHLFPYNRQTSKIKIGS